MKYRGRLKHKKYLDANYVECYIRAQGYEKHIAHVGFRYYPLCR